MLLLHLRAGLVLKIQLVARDPMRPYMADFHMRSDLVYQ
ncbi:Uncharacterised protein [Streptococcus pneumoniae]|nr:Uncharacterised protein [Streptococcus pneumoniae]